MSNAPHLLPGARGGFKYGPGVLLDALDSDALVCGFDGISMGAATERYQAGLGISRADQDAFAAESHARAAAATKAGRLAEEITPVTVPRKGNVAVEQDEGVWPGTTAQRLAGLPPAFSEGGTITAGSASQLSDGACAVVVMSKDRASRLGLPWLAEIGSYGSVAGPDPSLLRQPANAVRDALRRDGTLGAGDLDLTEINEAFAGVAIASARDLGATADRVNVNGGAIAIGHPVGMSGARLVLTLALELRRRGGGTGAAALCGGGGQGDALILRVSGDLRHGKARQQSCARDSGIGLAIAHRFVEEGAYVYITGRRAGELGKVAAEIGRNIAAVQGDITDLGHLDDLYQRIAAEKGVPDILVANAGYVELATLADATPEHFDLTFGTNTRAVFFTVQKALPLLRDHASVILVASNGHIRGKAKYSTYFASKAALRSFARTWADELKDRQIRVNTLSPGPIDTPIIDAHYKTPAEAEAGRAMFARTVPLARMGQVREIAAAALYLAADATYTTGSDLMVDGGQSQL